MAEVAPAPRASIVICAFNGASVLEACLRSLERLAPSPTYEIIVVDNASADESAALVERTLPTARLIRNATNLGFAGGNNVGLRVARGEFAVLLNQDTEVAPDFLARLLAPFVRDPRVGAVGCRLVYPDGVTIQHAGGILMPNGNTCHIGVGEPDRGQYDGDYECAYVCGAALALRRRALDEVGLLDERFFPAYYEELDLQTRMRAAGWRVWYTGAARVVHHEAPTYGASTARFVFNYTRQRLLYLALHGLPAGRGAALVAEARWLLDLARRPPRLWAALRAYAHGARNWRKWMAWRTGSGAPRMP